MKTKAKSVSTTKKAIEPRSPRLFADFQATELRAIRLREESRLVRKYAARFDRHLGAGSVVSPNSLACALDIDEEQARELISSGVFKTVTIPSRLGSAFDHEHVPAAELVRFLEQHGRSWFAGRLEKLIEDLTPGRNRLARPRQTTGFRS